MGLGGGLSSGALLPHACGRPALAHQAQQGHFDALAAVVKQALVQQGQQGVEDGGVGLRGGQAGGRRRAAVRGGCWQGCCAGQGRQRAAAAGTRRSPGPPASTHTRERTHTHTHTHSATHLEDLVHKGDLGCGQVALDLAHIQVVLQAWAGGWGGGWGGEGSTGREVGASEPCRGGGGQEAGWLSTAGSRLAGSAPQACAPGRAPAPIPLTLHGQRAEELLGHREAGEQALKVLAAGQLAAGAQGGEQSGGSKEVQAGRKPSWVGGAGRPGGEAGGMMGLGSEEGQRLGT